MKIDITQNPIEQWKNNLGYAQQFRKLMAEPCMQAAVQVLMFKGLMPQDQFLSREEHADVHVRQQGYWNCLRDLNSLGLVQQAEVPDPEPFLYTKEVSEEQ
jgi:hypothetical protein